MQNPNPPTYKYPVQYAMLFLGINTFITAYVSYFFTMDFDVFTVTFWT